MSDDGDSRAVKYHEGWTLHKPSTITAKTWTKYWMVLRGEKLFLFNSEKTIKDTLVGMLLLNADTILQNRASSKTFKFLLTTVSMTGEKKSNIFKFESENERDLWKSFIMAVSTGIVPNDTQLLPGQLYHVNEALQDIHNNPPQVPTVPRPPRLASQRISVDSGHASFDTCRSDNGSIDVISDFSDAEIRMLIKRQSNLMTRELGTGSDVETYGKPCVEQQQRNGSFGSVQGNCRHSTADVVLRKNTTGNGDHELQRSSYGFHRFNSISSSSTVSDSLGFHETLSLRSYGSTQENHIFYLDYDQNKATPPWFFDSCSREEAEGVLTVGRKYGNVMMRTSSNFSATGKYVISYRQEDAGVTKLHHYSVTKVGSEFKIDVKNEHKPLKSLFEMMTFFASVAGPTTRMMSTNDLSVIYGRTKGLQVESFQQQTKSRDSFTRSSPPQTANNSQRISSLSDNSDVADLSSVHSSSPKSDTPKFLPPKSVLAQPPKIGLSKQSSLTPVMSVSRTTEPAVSANNDADEIPSSVAVLREKLMRTTSIDNDAGLNTIQRMNRSSSASNQFPIIKTQTPTNENVAMTNYQQGVTEFRSPLPHSKSIDLFKFPSHDNNYVDVLRSNSSGFRISVGGKEPESSWNGVADQKKKVPPPPPPKPADLNFEDEPNCFHIENTPRNNAITPQGKVFGTLYGARSVSLPPPPEFFAQPVPSEEIYSNANEVFAPFGSGSGSYAASSEPEPTNSVAVLRQKLLENVGKAAERAESSQTTRSSACRQSYTGQVSSPGMSMEEELSGKLGRRREEIYSTHGAVLKSNFE